MTGVDQALLTLHDLLKPIKGDWMVIGTSSLYLAGCPVVPNDIDILCDVITAREIECLLAGYKIDSQVKPNDKFRSIFSQYNCTGFSVEVMGDLKVNTPEGWIKLLGVIKKVIITHYAGKAFKTPSLSDQLRIYALFNRAKDAPILQMLSKR